MNKSCARCLKTVYPIEELKCLDKIWHKGCFKCQECNMTLNMRTYKGYGKLPYCEAHIPKVKPTTMAETPELKRIAENTKIQSNVKYHADFEKSKGKFTQVADDPETLRIKANSKIISNVAYHGDLEKKAQMEKQRAINDNGEIVEESVTDNYHIQLENYATEMLPNVIPPPISASYQQQAPPQQPPPQQQQQQYQNNVKHHAPPASDNNYNKTRQVENSYQYQYKNDNNIHDYQPQYQNQNHNVQISSYTSNVPQTSIYDNHYNDNNSYHNKNVVQQQTYQDNRAAAAAAAANQHRIGRIADYDPISDGPRNSPIAPRQGSTVVYNSGPVHGGHIPQQQQQQHHHHQQQQMMQMHQNNGRIAHHGGGAPPGSRRIGSVADMDPVNDVYGSSVHHHPQQHHQPPQAKMAVNNRIPERVYIAMYDYQATDTDEVSFREGDLITNVSDINEGWMTGRVQRTGHTGMLPANYVDLAQI